MSPVLLGGPLVCTIRFNENARTIITHANIARRMSWPKANKKVIARRRNQKKKRSKQLLRRRAKRAQRPGGNQRSDRAKRSSNKQSIRRNPVVDIGGVPRSRRPARRRRCSGCPLMQHGESLWSAKPGGLRGYKWPSGRTESCPNPRALPVAVAGRNFHAGLHLVCGTHLAQMTTGFSPASELLVRRL